MRGRNLCEFFCIFFFLFYVENHPPDTILCVLAHLTDLNLQTSLEETNKNTRCDVREMWFRKSRSKLVKYVDILLFHITDIKPHIFTTRGSIRHDNR